MHWAVLINTQACGHIIIGVTNSMEIRIRPTGSEREIVSGMVYRDRRRQSIGNIRRRPPDTRVPLGTPGCALQLRVHGMGQPEEGDRDN
ncbi:hypothetical protein BHU16_07740 [Tannerella sp. oral taxon 808]|nr:hypothetical protein BHU16_07740 [Tannerella sp. oral taxon 808]